MLTITKGELWQIRQTLEEGDLEDRIDALEIVNAILDKNIEVHITEDSIYQKEWSEEELAILVELQDREDLSYET